VSSIQFSKKSFSVEINDSAKLPFTEIIVQTQSELISVDRHEKPLPLCNKDDMNEICYAAKSKKNLIYSSDTNQAYIGIKYYPTLLTIGNRSIYQNAGMFLSDRDVLGWQ